MGRKVKRFAVEISRAAVVRHTGLGITPIMKHLHPIRKKGVGKLQRHSRAEKLGGAQNIGLVIGRSNHASLEDRAWCSNKTGLWTHACDVANREWRG